MQAVAVTCLMAGLAAVAQPPPGVPVPVGQPGFQPMPQAQRQPPPPVFAIPLLWVVLLPALLAADRARKQSAEEDEFMPPDAPGAEFKIVRFAYGFRTPAARAEALAGEAAAGWELFEVLDDRRLRLRRDTSWRATDADRPGDPYRTLVVTGAGPQVRRSLLVGCGALVALLAGGVVISQVVK